MLRFCQWVKQAKMHQLRAFHQLPALGHRSAGLYTKPALLSRPWTNLRRANGRFHVLAAGKGTKVVYRCNQDGCGQETLQPQAKCPSCGVWNSIKPIVVEPESKGGGAGLNAIKALNASRQAPRSSYGPSPTSRPANPSRQPGTDTSWVGKAKNNGPERLYDIAKFKRGKHWRIPLSGPTGLELGRVLGGGVVPGSMTLLGGDPGIGKSTLLLQLAGMLVEPSASQMFAQSNAPTQNGSTAPDNSLDGSVSHGNGAHGNSVGTNGKFVQEDNMSKNEIEQEEQPGVLYVSAEESAEQVNSRAERMEGLDLYNIWVLAETRLMSIMQDIRDMQPRAVVIDSIQTVYLDGATGTAGSVSQVRECAAALTRLCKEEGIPMFLVGHVTKSGDIAGPRVLEHMVDTVLYMEGEGQQRLRLLRGIKNRFGATNEVGVFTMDEKGLLPVENPSALFISQRDEESEGASSAVCVTLNGNRPLLVEIQALCTESHQGRDKPPLRTHNGLDRNRLNQIEAIVRKYSNIPRVRLDMHTNVIGGFKIQEPAADLAIAIAIASSSMEKSVPGDIAFIGELGLNGEIRNVTNLAQRVQEVDKLGFKRCVIPHMTKQTGAVKVKDLKLLPCKKFLEALLYAIGPD